MKKALVKIHNIPAGILIEENQQHYIFQYSEDYRGPPVSLTMPISQLQYSFSHFPPFFDGLLPEGVQLEGILKRYKIDRYDFFEQLLVTGADLVGAVTVERVETS